MENIALSLCNANCFPSSYHESLSSIIIFKSYLFFTCINNHSHNMKSVIWWRAISTQSSHFFIFYLLVISSLLICTNDILDFKKFYIIYNKILEKWKLKLKKDRIDKVKPTQISWKNILNTMPTLEVFLC